MKNIDLLVNRFSSMPKRSQQHVTTTLLKQIRKLRSADCLRSLLVNTIALKTLKSLAGLSGKNDKTVPIFLQKCKTLTKVMSTLEQ